MKNNVLLILFLVFVFINVVDMVTAFFIVKGDVEMTVDGKTFFMKLGEVLPLVTQQRHTFKAVSDCVLALPTCVFSILDCVVILFPCAD